MGGHYGTIHVRTDGRAPVQAAVEAIATAGKHRFLIAPPLHGWVTVFPSRNGQDSKISQILAQALPDKTLIHCLVHDDDVFAYWLYERGALVDAYDSCPGYFSGEKTPPSGGNVEALRHLMSDVAKMNDLKQLLKGERRTIELERQDEFAALLGLPHTDRAYEYLIEGETEGVRQWKQFIHVPDRTSEKAAQRAAAAREKAEYKNLQRDGLLLVSESGKKSSNKQFYRSPFESINPCKSEVFLSWPDVMSDGSPDPEWFRFGPPDWRSEKAELPTFGRTQRLAFSPTGAWLLTSPPGSSRLDLWDAREKKVAIQKDLKGLVTGTAFSPDERWLFVVVRQHPPDRTEIHRLALRPELKDAVFTTEQLHFGPPIPHSGGQLLAALDNFGMLVVFDVEEMRIVQETWIKQPNAPGREEFMSWLDPDTRERFRQEFKRHHPSRTPPADAWECDRYSVPKEAIRVCEFSPDGELLVCGTTHGVRVLEWKAVLECGWMQPAPVKIATEAEETTIELQGVSIQQKSVMGIAFDAARRRLLFCGMEGKISFLELEGGKRGDLIVLPAPMPLFVMALTQDRAAIVVTGQRLGATSTRDTPGHFQIWSYRALCTRAGVGW